MTSSATERKAEAGKLLAEAIRLLHGHKHDKARAILLKCEEKFPEFQELQARVRSFLKVCDNRENPAAAPAKEDAEETYVRGLVQHNRGRYTEAVEVFEQALKKASSDGDYIHLAMAASHARQGNVAEALKHLKRSIELDRSNRFTALNDPDFEPLLRNDEFQKLVRPGSRRK